MTETRRAALTEQVAQIHAEVKARYGSPRVHAELVDRGHGCCVNAVARVMRQAGVAAETRREFRQTTDSNHPHPVVGTSWTGRSTRTSRTRRGWRT